MKVFRYPQTYWNLGMDSAKDNEYLYNKLTHQILKL